MSKKDQVTQDNYVELAMRTDAPSTAELIHRMTHPGTIRMLHSVLGLTSEVGELADMLKKHIFAGKAFDAVNAKEELGDIEWYIALALDVMHSTMQDIMQMNIDKLRLRYPDKFLEGCSANRNTVAERNLLENADQAKPSQLSLRGQDWLRFSADVLNHIENYTVPQYGDKGTDRATHYTTEVRKEHIGRYRDRMGSNSRGEVEAKRDMIKIAHYASLEYQS